MLHAWRTIFFPTYSALQRWSSVGIIWALLQMGFQISLHLKRTCRTILTIVFPLLFFLTAQFSKVLGQSSLCTKSLVTLRTFKLFFPMLNLMFFITPDSHETLVANFAVKHECMLMILVYVSHQ